MAFLMALPVSCIKNLCVLSEMTRLGLIRSQDLFTPGLPGGSCEAVVLLGRGRRVLELMNSKPGWGDSDLKIEPLYRHTQHHSTTNNQLHFTHRTPHVHTSWSQRTRTAMSTSTS